MKSDPHSRMERLRSAFRRPLPPCFLLLALFTGQAAAHGDEDHSQQPAPAAVHSATASPQRLADGSLFIPKPTQRQLGLRTRISKTEALAVTLTFNGKVVADPNANGRVHAIQAGRIEAGPKGLPSLGQRVRKGEVLAWLKPAASSLERGNQQAVQAELEAQLAIAERRVLRLEQLAGAVPQKEIEAARIELEALKKRRSAIGASLTATEALLAPISGVISSSAVVAGQVVDAREVLFEVIDPTRLAVEALAYENLSGGLIGDASAQTSDGSIALRFIGAGRQLREQAMPLMFRIAPGNTTLAIGQPVKVIARTRKSIQGITAPQSALTKNASGDTLVWLHNGAERFTPRSVKIAPLSADSVAISAGVQDGDRIVITGASLLAQIR